MLRRINLLGIVILILLTAVVGLVSAQDSLNEDEPAPEVTEVPQFDTQGYVRFAHFAPDAGAVEIYVDGDAYGESMSYTNFSEWMVLSSGSHSVNVVPAGEAEDESVFMTTLIVNADTWSTIGLVEGQDGISASIIQQAMYTTLPSTSQATFANLMSDGNSVDFTRDGVVFVAALPITTGDTVVQNSIPIDAFDWKYNVRINGTEDLLVEDNAVDTVDTSSYLIVAGGTADEPVLIVNETPNWKVRLLDGSLAAPATLLEAAQAEPLAQPFLSAMEEAGLTDLLTSSDPITIFVPADYVMDDVDLSSDNLEAILRHHIVEGNYKAGDLFREPVTLTTIDGETLSVTQTNQVFVDNAQIIEVNATAENGTIHIINEVLSP